MWLPSAWRLLRCACRAGRRHGGHLSEHQEKKLRSRSSLGSSLSNDFSSWPQRYFLDMILFSLSAMAKTQLFSLISSLVWIFSLSCEEISLWWMHERICLFLQKICQISASNGKKKTQSENLKTQMWGNVKILKEDDLTSPSFSGGVGTFFIFWVANVNNRVEGHNKLKETMFQAVLLLLSKQQFLELRRHYCFKNLVLMIS